MKRALTVCLVFFAVLALSIPALATIEQCASTATSNGAYAWACPQGDGATLGDVGSFVQVVLRDANGNLECTGLGTEDLRITAVGATIYALYADADLGNCEYAFGSTPFPPMGTSHEHVGFNAWYRVGVWWIIKDDVLELCGQNANTYLNITVRNLDLKGPYNGPPDGKIDSVDVTEFGNHFEPLGGTYDSSCDFNGDGTVDKVDWTIFANHYQHHD